MSGSSMPMRNFTVSGTPSSRRGPRRGADDVGEQPPPHGQRGAAALAGDLGDRAAEVEVDVLDAVAVDEAADRLVHGAGRGAVELDAARRRLVGAAAACASVFSLPSTRARAVTISLTYSRPGANSRHSVRNAWSVTPAIGASTTGASSPSGPMLQRCDVRAHRSITREVEVAEQRGGTAAATAR